MDFSDKVKGVEDIRVGRIVGFYGIEYWFVKNIWDLVFSVFLEAFRVI